MRRLAAEFAIIFAGILLQDMAGAAAAATPWLVDNQFQALQNSGHVRLLRKIQPDMGLARNEAAVATAKWYALARIKENLQTALEELSQWDRSPTSVEEDLARCGEAFSMPR